MKDILRDIISDKRIEVEKLKKDISIDNLYNNATEHKHADFRLSIENTSNGIIAEFKRRSPSKGWIHRDAKPEDVAPGYEKNGAAAMSVLTDEKYFGGTLEDVANVRQLVKMPILRKDFTIDEYQLHQAKAFGADAVLLIAAAISETECRKLARIAHELGLETLLEVHNEDEISYLCDDIDVVGVNNRHLGTFHTDISTSEFLAPQLPQSITRISESGIRSASDIIRLQILGYRGFLIGEQFMSGDNPPENLGKLNADIEKLITSSL